ncbi:MAG: hypothetical protein SFU86_05690 [Pirellulaceae bacterium]|nr:hypothetical protein [Pirellulaceae bacterium]
MIAAPTTAQDTVITSSASDPEARLKKQGQILDFTGVELKLRSALGKDETIPAARVVEIQTAWTPAHQQGNAERLAGNLDAAIAAYRQAKRDESRPWAVRQTMAELAGTYLEAGRIDNAGDEFLAIVASDPATPHYDIVPIAWRVPIADAALDARAQQWLEAKQFSAARLLGASWLLAGPQRSVAIAALDELTKNADPRIAGLALIQLWRTKLITARPADVAPWQSQLERMPSEIQATGWYVLGDVLSRQDQPERAALAYLKVPVLFGRQRGMAADALLAAGKQLEKMGRRDEAAGLYREVMRDFGHLAAAREAETRLKGK